MKVLIKNKWNEKMGYKEITLYILIFIVLFSASLFLIIYVLFVPFMPAIIVHIVYILYHLFLLVMMKKKHYKFVKISILSTYVIQLTLAVYLWFPVTTNYNLFYYLVPVTTFITMDIENKRERNFAIFLSTIATLLFLGSVFFDMNFYLYELNRNVILILSTMTIFSTFVPASFIFYQYSKGLMQKQNELKWLANTDSLTQITNRRLLFELGEQEVKLAKKYKYDFSLIVFDIDFFKRVNDTYGHPTGDVVLIQLSQLIQEHIRKEDTFSRHGGEEFAIILRKTNKESGFVIAEKLRSVVEDYIFGDEGTNIHITISLGIVQYETKFETFGDLMLTTDKALYEAKEMGRNRVIMK